MYYFAYASNLNRKQMAERCPDSQHSLSMKGFLGILDQLKDNVDIRIQQA